MSPFLNTWSMVTREESQPPESGGNEHKSIERPQ